MHSCLPYLPSMNRAVFLSFWTLFYFSTEVLSQSACFQASDLLVVTGNYSAQIPEAIPACAQFYQDIGGGFQTFTLLSEVNGVAWADLLPNQQNQWTLKWFKEGEPDPWFTGTPPPFNELNWSCDGTFYLTLQMTHSTGVQYTRVIPALIAFALIDYPECASECTFDEASGFEFFPEVEPFFYVTQWAYGDINGDMVVDVNDLLLVVGGYCEAGGE